MVVATRLTSKGCSAEWEAVCLGGGSGLGGDMHTGTATATNGSGYFYTGERLAPSEAGNYKNGSQVTGSTSGDTVQHNQQATLSSPRPEVGNFR